MKTKRINFLLSIFLILTTFSHNALAINLEEMDFFASIKASEANIRSGPGTNYQVKFTYNYKYIPVRVIGKYDNWHEIEDYEGEKGWINRNLISKKRTIIISTNKSSVNLYLAANDKSRIALKLENKVIAKLIGCNKDWCKVQVSGKKGWLNKKNFWGT